jgi:hypothetical protein
MKKFEKDKAAVAAMEQREANLALFREWMEKKHPEIKLGVAVENLFREYMDFEEDSLTVEDFEFALGNLGSKIYGREHVPTEGELKAALIGKIKELTSKDGVSLGTTFKLAVDGGKRVVHWSVQQLPHWNIPQLTELLDELVRKRVLMAQPASDLQQIAASGRSNYGYPAYPKTVVRPGTVRAIPRDAAYLKSLEPWELKKENRLYGVEAVNKRLRGEE